MRFYTSELAQRIVNRIGDDLQWNVHSIQAVQLERDSLTKRADAVIVFLFTTLFVIAVYLGDSGKSYLAQPPEFLGITIFDLDLFIFAALIMGNVLYIVHIGLFLKIFILESMIFYIITDNRFGGSRVFPSLLYSYHANVFAFLRFANLIKEESLVVQIIFAISRIYTRYLIIFAYALTYFVILFIFLNQLWYKENLEASIYFWVLIAANAMSTIVSFSIFLPASLGSERLRQRRLEHDR